MNEITPNEDKLYTVKSHGDLFSFIVSHSEADSLRKRITLTNKSFDELTLSNDVILIERKKLNKLIRKGYKPLQVLQESDHYIWMCRKEIFKETVAYEPRKRDNTLIDDLDREILEGKHERKKTWSQIYSMQ